MNADPTPSPTPKEKIRTAMTDPSPAATNYHPFTPDESGQYCQCGSKADAPIHVVTPVPSPVTEIPEIPENPDFEWGYDVGWQDATDAGIDRDKLALAIEDYMSSGGHEFRAYDLADCIIRHLVGEMKL